MNAILKTSGIVCLSMIFSSAVFASDEMIELQQRLDRLEQRVAPSEASAAKGIVFNALVEVEGSYVDGAGEKSTTALELATFELGMKAQLNPWLSAHGVLLYEEGGDDDVMVEEAYIRLKSESSPLFVEAGRFTQSFGNFASDFVSDPLTLELAETKHHASLRAGYEQGLVCASLTLFKGDVQKNDDDDINSIVGSLSLKQESDTAFRYEVGASYLNNFADTDGLQEGFGGVTADIVGGYGLYAVAGFNDLELRCEYIAAAEAFTDGSYAGKQPEAWNVEAGYKLPSSPLAVALRYAGADDFGDVKAQYGAAVSWEVAEGAALGLEYLRTENHDRADGNGVTMQLAMEF
jgi:hypothetical protein